MNLLFDGKYEIPIGYYFVRTTNIFNDTIYEDDITFISPETYRTWREYKKNLQK